MTKHILTEQELKQAISNATNHSKWGLRNRLLLLVTHMTGIDRNALAGLRLADVLDLDGEIRDEIQLPNAAVVLPSRLRQELKCYITTQFDFETLEGTAYAFGHFPLFYTQKRNAFTPTTLTQTFTAIYRRAGLRGATTKTGKCTWLNTLLVRGANIKAVQQLAGRRRLGKAMLPNSALLRAVAEMI